MPIQEAKNQGSKWLGDLNPMQNASTYTVVPFQFTTNSILPMKPMLSCNLLPKFPVQKFLMTHILIYRDTRQWKTSMVTLPPLQTEPHQGPHWHLTSTNWWSDDVVVNIPIQTLLYFCHESYFTRWSSHSWSLGCLCKHYNIFQRTQIAFALQARAIFVVFEKFTYDY